MCNQLPRDVKVNKHQVKRTKLSTQLGYAYSIGFESRSSYVERVELSTKLWNIVFWIGFNPVVERTSHPPTNWKIHFRMTVLNPINFQDEKLST